MISSLKSCSSVCETVIPSAGICLHLHYHRSSCWFHFFGFQIWASWSHWASAMVRPQFGFLGVVPYLGWGFFHWRPLWFYIKSLFSIGHLGICLSFINQSFMNISYMGILGLLPDNLWDWWKCYVDYLRSVSRSSGVKTWHL